MIGFQLGGTYSRARLCVAAALLFWLTPICWAAAADGSIEAGAAAGELIQERYPNREVKIEREVALDAAGNYVNHGSWRMWDPAGNLVGEGEYDMGQRVGVWTRWHERGEAPLLGEYPLTEFAAPFISQAAFVGGKLHGDWVIYDAHQNVCSRVSFNRGRRDGKATLWLPGGQIHSEATFRNGVPVGDVLERCVTGELTPIATYVDGHQLVNKITHFPATDVKQTEATYLGATTVEATPDDFWQLRMAEYATQGDDQRHGPWRMWHSNGQLQLEGSFQYDRESGPFVWWHANGQKAVEGVFVDGQQDGQWVWWHANGQKAALGSYRYGGEVGDWHSWADNGRLTQRTAAASIAGSPVERPVENPVERPVMQVGQRETAGDAATSASLH